MKAKQDAKKIVQINPNNPPGQIGMKHLIVHCISEPCNVDHCWGMKRKSHGTNGTSIGESMEQTLECCWRSTSRGRSLCQQNRAPEQFGVNWKMFFLKYLCYMYVYDIYAMKTEQAQVYIELSLWP